MLELYPNFCKRLCDHSYKHVLKKQILYLHFWLWRSVYMWRQRVKTEHGVNGGDTLIGRMGPDLAPCYHNLMLHVKKFWTLLICKQAKNHFLSIPLSEKILFITHRMYLNQPCKKKYHRYEEHKSFPWRQAISCSVHNEYPSFLRRRFVHSEDARRWNGGFLFKKSEKSANFLI